MRDLNHQEEDLSSLSDGMVSQRRPHFQPQEDPTVFNAEGSPWQSPAAKMAQDIRDRNTRLGLGRTSFTQGGGTGMNSKTGRNPTGKTGITGMTNSAGKGGKVPPAKWDANALRAAYFKGKRDFADLDLGGLNLQKANLAGANFYESRFTRANLQGVDLSEANLGHARLVQANLRDANLAQAYCSTANFEGADLRGANLTGVYLSKANLRGANLCGANLTDATVSDEQLSLAKTNWMTIKPDGKRGFGL
jgi:serine/threonine-protein kinase